MSKKFNVEITFLEVPDETKPDHKHKSIYTEIEAENFDTAKNKILSNLTLEISDDNDLMFYYDLISQGSKFCSGTAESLNELSSSLQEAFDKQEEIPNVGMETILDLHKCNVEKFNRDSIEQYSRELCQLIDMDRCLLCFWDKDSDPKSFEELDLHLHGTSAVQFIKTSNITVHTFDNTGVLWINICSCKDFIPEVAEEFTAKFFDCKEVVQSVTLKRY